MGHLSTLLRQTKQLRTSKKIMRPIIMILFLYTKFYNNRMSLYDLRCNVVRMNTRFNLYPEITTFLSML